jgi:hypothetical protein
MCDIPNLETLPFWSRSAEVPTVSLAEIDLTRPSCALAHANIDEEYVEKYPAVEVK